jgi:hypothetical protein
MLSCTLKQPQKNKFTPGEPVEYILILNDAVEFTEYGLPLTKELFEETCYHCLERIENYTPGIWSFQKESF